MVEALRGSRLRGGVAGRPHRVPLLLRVAYRSRRGRGDIPDAVAVFTTGEAHEHAVPWDVWQAGRRLSFSVGALFTRLSGPVVNALDRSDLDALYAAQAREPPARPLGESRTRRFTLRHVFGIAPETIKQASDLPRVLLRLHYRRRRLPWHLELISSGRSGGSPRSGRGPGARIVPDRDAFLAFLQGTVAGLPGPPDFRDGGGARPPLVRARIGAAGRPRGRHAGRGVLGAGRRGLGGLPGPLDGPPAPRTPRLRRR